MPDPGERRRAAKRTTRPIEPAPPDLGEETPPPGRLPRDLRGAEIRVRLLADLDATGADASGVEISECSLERVDLSAGRLRRASIRDTRVDGGSWANVEASESVVKRAVFRGVRLTGATFANARIEDASFVECRIDFASFRFAELARVRFEACRLDETDLYRVQASSVVFASCTLSRASLAEAAFERSEMRDCDLTGAGNAERLRGVAMPWTDVLRNAGTLADALGVVVLDDE